MPPAEKKPPETPKPRRRWKRRVFGFLVVVALLLIWANGPGIRWGVKKVILQQLAAQKLTGSFEVTGSALSGLAIHNISLTGESQIQSVQANLLRLDWSLSSLLKKEAEALTLDSLHLVIDPSAPALPISSEEDSGSTNEPTPLSGTLNLIRGFIQPAEITITDLKVDVIDTTSVSLASFSHTSGSTHYLISDLRTKDHLNRLIHNPKSILTWNSDGFALDQLTLLPQLAIRDLIFHPEQKASANLLIGESKLTLTSDLENSHRLTLASPTLSIATVARLVDPKLLAAGTITALEIDTSKGLVNLQGSDLQWEEQKLASASIEAHARDLLSPYDQAIDIKVTLADQLALNGTVTPNKELLDSTADLSFTLTYPDIPTVTGEVAYDSREARLIANTLDDLIVTGRYLVDSSTYQAEAISKIKDAGTLEKSLAGPLDFTLTAKGDVENATHSGTLNLTRLQLNQDGLPDATTSGVIQYDWPKEVTIRDLKMTSPEGQLHGNLSWQNDILTISRLDLIENGTRLLSATGQLPASLEIKTLDDFIDSPESVSLEIKSQPLTLKKLSSFVPIPEELSGIVQADLSLSGTLANPSLNGFTTLDDFRSSFDPDLPPVDISLKFKTENQKLLLTAGATEPGGPLLNVDGKLPFLPRAWIDREKDPNNGKLEIRAYSPELDLRRAQPFVPAINSITGNLKLDVIVTGTIANPKYAGSAKARISKMRIQDSPISTFRDTSFDVTFLGKVATIQPSTINAAGGSAKISGTVNLEGNEPVFDINLNGRYLLLHRSADYTFRGHTNLDLRGPLSAATLSGKVELTESLFYKDIEILPFGVPRTTDIPKPNLPSFSRAPTPSAPDEKKSSGVMDWRLDIRVSTLDAILIRGNLARGDITGNVRVYGTIGAPKTAGTLTSKDLEADLPFSNLQVQTAIVTLRPDSLTNPLVNLRGSSTVGQYTIQVYLTGPVQNPNLILTSNPPLPESEIMLLLATGSASDQLEDRQVASQKALQYLLEGIRRRNGDKDKTVLQRILKNSSQIELSLGDTSQFSGRKYSSATLEIQDKEGLKWDFTTQIDQQGESRALVIFSVRFR